MKYQCLNAGGGDFVSVGVPTESDFRDEAFLDAPGAKIVAEHVQQKFPEVFDHLDLDRIKFLWNAKGGQSGKRNTLGKVGKLSPKERHFLGYDADFWIWFAADHVRESRFDAQQFEALVFHELKHLQLDDDGAVVVVGHDFEGFAQELEIYGPWSGSAAKIVRAIQPSFFEELEGVETKRAWVSLRRLANQAGGDLDVSVSFSGERGTPGLESAMEQ